MFNDGTAKGSIRKMTDFAKNNALPVGFEYFTFNSNVAVGSLPYLGSEYSRSAYADLWSWAQEQPGYVITEAEWQEKYVANNGNVPYYSDGDGSTTFRVPSIKCWVKGGSDNEVGQYKEAGLPNILGTFGLRGKVGFGATDTNGAFYKTSDVFDNAPGYTSGSPSSYLNFDASLSNPIYGNADTVQPESIVGIWCVIAFGTITNTGSQDVEQISQGLSNAEGRISELENNFAIIYPNGGTAENPAEVATNSRYVEKNPFKGYYVSCIPQIYFNDKWFTLPWNSDAGTGHSSYGISASAVNDEIIIWIGSQALCVTDSQAYILAQPITGITENLTSAPCRVLVYRLGKIGE